MSYINAIHDYKTDSILVWERNNGEKISKRYKPPRYFYIPDKNGKYTSIYGDKLKKLEFDNKKEFEQAVNSYRNTFESDIKPIDRVLMDNYYNKPVPDLHYTLLDIEVDFKTKNTDDYSGPIGFSSPDNPYAPINAITFYHQWKNTYKTIAIPPPNWSGSLDDFKSDFIDDELKNILSKTEIILVQTEIELLELMIDEIQDSDIISGWNSEFFDLPYMIKRVELVLGPSKTSRFSFLNAGDPRWEQVERFGEMQSVVRIYGRYHLDYLDLFKKFTFGGRPSYSLANIAEDELSNIPKLEYDGSLASLYTGENELDISKIDIDRYNNGLLENCSTRNKKYSLDIIDKAIEYILNNKKHLIDSNLDISVYENMDISELKIIQADLKSITKRLSFAYFLAYNCRDVEIIELLDEKFQFINLANELAHANTVPLDAVMGSVRIIDTGIMNHCHYELNLIVNNNDSISGDPIKGAMVLEPKVGRHKNIGSIDINSLYPSTYRALNISPEKIIGQFTNKEKDWENIHNKSNNISKLILENGDTAEHTGKEWHKVLKSKKWAISAYGTVLDQSSGVGFIPDLLANWYSNRKANQKKVIELKTNIKNLLKSSIQIPEDF